MAYIKKANVYSKGDFERDLNTIPVPPEILQSNGGPVRDGTKNLGTWLMVNNRPKFNEAYSRFVEFQNKNPALPNRLERFFETLEKIG